MKTFDDEVKITGAIVTKMDGDARGGAALSISEVRYDMPALTGGAEWLGNVLQRHGSRDLRVGGDACG